MRNQVQKFTFPSLMAVVLIAALSLIISSMQPAHAASSSTRSYKSVKWSSSTKAKKIKKAKKSFVRDDDVECSDLRFSTHAADREVYRRYCQ